MNIHITKLTRFQSWEGRTIFGDYPLHLRPGNFTVTLLFADADSVRRLYEMLGQLLAEIGTKTTPAAGCLQLAAKTKRR